MCLLCMKHKLISLLTVELTDNVAISIACILAPLLGPVSSLKYIIHSLILIHPTAHIRSHASSVRLLPTLMVVHESHILAKFLASHAQRPLLPCDTAHPQRRRKHGHHRHEFRLSCLYDCCGFRHYRVHVTERAVLARYTDGRTREWYCRPSFES